MLSTLATLEASRISDICLCVVEHTAKRRDLEQAFLQASHEGTTTYIMLAKELWTLEVHNMKHPFSRRARTLYDHKHCRV